MAETAGGAYAVYVAWQAYNVGTLTFDFSTFDGPDRFGVSIADASFDGPYDDVSARADRMLIQGGRSNTFEVMQGGTATVDLRDPDGLYNPNNPSSPLHDLLGDRLHPVQIIGGQTPSDSGHYLFYGWVRRLEWEPQGRRGITQLECVDFFYMLERIKPVIPSTGPTTTGAAIELVIAATLLADPGLYADVDAGDTIPDFSADGTLTGRELIEGLLAAERGTIYVREGVFRYRSRINRLLEPTLATIENEMHALGSGVDLDTPRSKVTVKRTQNDYEAVAVADDDITALVGVAETRIETAYLSSDAAADDLAAWVLLAAQEPQRPLYNLGLDDRTAEQYTQLLTYGLGHRVAVTEDRGNTTGDFYIEHVTHEITARPRRHRCSWLLASASTLVPAVFDGAAFDDGSVFVY